MNMENTNSQGMSEFDNYASDSHDIVEYAKELYHNQGLSWKQVKYALRENGFDERQVDEIVDNLKEEHNLIESNAEKDDLLKKKEEEIFGTKGSKSPMQRADNKILIGLILSVIGAILWLIGVLGGGGKLLIRYGSIGVSFGIFYVIIGYRHRSLITKKNNSLNE